MEQLGSDWTNLYEILYLRIFRQSVEKFQGLFKPDKSNGYITCGPPTFVIISRWILLKMRNVSEESGRENNNTHFLFIRFCPKIVQFMR